MALVSTFCGQYTGYVAIVLASYLVVVRTLRYRRLQRLDANREFKFSEKPGLTPAQAQRILRVSLQYDIPWITTMAVRFALFKTYGIPTIAGVLNKTEQLTKRETSGKRYMDTSLLINSWVFCPIYGPGSGAACPANSADIDPRNALAVARTNWLHGRYPSISNDDLLYTLSLFILEPARWSQEYDWRGFSELERQALVVFWVEIGCRLGIKGIPSTYEDILAWSEDYERDNMVPSKPNKVLAARTVELLLYRVPEVLKPLGRIVVSCLMGDRLRNAVCVPPPPPLLQKFVKGALRARGFVIRHFALPRLMPFCYLEAQATFVPGEGTAALPRLQTIMHDNEPWYYPESTGGWKLLEIIMVKLGLATPTQLPGSHFQSKGYRMEELGPTTFDKVGHEKVMQMAEAMQGAPIVGPFSMALNASDPVRCPMSIRSW
ncbi:hypothetical protein BU17DRAFT_84290 [Hysterangium stoloniferum]|nr:hypothetical protein BU17DRAFT_84290 [Hysterangium stoloniferum]